MFQRKRRSAESTGKPGTDTLRGTDNDVTYGAQHVNESIYALGMIAVVVGYENKRFVHLE